MRTELGFLLLSISFCVRGDDDFYNEPLSHGTAVGALYRVGVTICSRGRCIDRANPDCISLEQVRRRCVFLARNLRTASRCPIVVIGGTEVGHQPGTYSHWNGWKIDIAENECVTLYIQANFPRIHDNFANNPRYLSEGKYVWTKKPGYWDVCCAAFPDV